jgi:alpha-L-rhamnosidase
MHKCVVSVAAGILVVTCGLPIAEGGAIAVTEATCEYCVDPLGVDTPSPRFGWILSATERGQRQTAYQILVSSTPEGLDAGVGDKWDSGKVASDRSVGVVYGGAALASGERCLWKVRCWDTHDQPSSWSAPAAFETGLLQESDWQAAWIKAGAGLTFRPGKFGQAVALNGTGDCVRIAHYATLKPSNAVTLCAWVAPSAALGADWREIYRKDDSTARHLLALGQTGSITGAWVGLGINGAYVEFGAPTSLDALKDGQWHLIAATYDGSFIRLYVDGAEIGSKPQTGALSTSGTQEAYIGSNKGQNEFFPGGIDDVRVYSRALSAGEIQAMAAAGAGADPSLVGWWKLDGDLLNSANGNNGEPRGGGIGSPLLRKEFSVAKPIERARVYVSGVGWSELYVNGSKVGDHVLDPAATDYDKRIFYVTYDVTSLLRAGSNVLGAMLGNGWFSEPPSPGYGDSPRLRLQTSIRFTDDTSMTVTSDDTWKGAGGPIISNDIFNGETYDARQEKTGWLLSGYDDSTWASALIAPSPGGVMQSQMMPPLKVNETIRPIALTNPAPGVYVYNMGQLFGGWVRLHVRGPAGTKVTLKYSARVFADTGLIDKTRHPEPRATDYYTLKGDADGEIYEPRFTYHPVGYVQVEGYPGVPTLDDLEGRVVHSSVDLTGDFECSNSLFNQIHRNAVWTLRNELYGILLDCLYREHWGWLEPGTDPSALFCRKHMPLFWEKFLNDAKFAQHEDGVIPDVIPAYPLKGRTTGDPAWAGNYPLVVWYVYQYFDNQRVLEEHYDSMKKWLDHLVAVSSNNLMTVGYYGDHMLPGPAPGQEEFISTQTPPSLLWTGFYYRDASIVAQAASILGKTVDAQQYAQLAANIKSALNANWLNQATSQYATGSQTSNLFPLVLGIVPEANLQGILNSIANNITGTYGGHFHTGNVGTSSLMDVSLAEHGLGDLMYGVVNQTTYPGWGYMVAQGATTLWEAWGLRNDVGSGEESMGMWNSIEEFFYRDIAGIGGPAYFGPGIVPPGFRQIDIRPHVLGDLSHASASIKTVRGAVSSSWRLTDSSFSLDVVVPANSSAQVSVPTFGLAAPAIQESGNTVWQGGSYVAGTPGFTGAAQDGDRVVFDVGSGPYSFVLRFAVLNRTRRKGYPAIQPAIDEAAPGDVLVVNTGIYHERLVFGGKNVTIRSAAFDDPSAVSATIIQADAAGAAVSFTGGEDETCRLIGLTITGGAATEEGGGILCNNSSPTISHCVIRQNTATKGAGMACLSSAPSLINCVFSSNSAGFGGGVYSSGSQPVLINCTFAGNSADSGTALVCRSPRLLQPSTVVMYNCVLWDGGSEVVNYDGSNILVACSDIRGGWPGEGNIDADPLFVRWPNGGYGDLRLMPCSPCIDTGESAVLPADSSDLNGDADTTEAVPFDLAGGPRVYGAFADMGAYEYQGPIPGIANADFDGDCDVDLADFARVQGCFNGPNRPYAMSDCRDMDFDDDGDVDLADFVVFQACFNGPNRPVSSTCPGR